MIDGVLDDLDLRILEILQEDGRRSYRDVGANLGVAPGTVRTRVLQMMDDGVVEIVAMPNPHRMGLVPALIGIRVDPGEIDTAAEMLAKLEAVSWVVITANAYDLIIEVVLRNLAKYKTFKQEVLAQIPGFVSADIYLETEIKKLRYRLAARSHAEDHFSLDGHVAAD